VQTRTRADALGGHAFAGAPAGMLQGAYDGRPDRDDAAAFRLCLADG
jgi:hypothetical protein